MIRKGLIASTIVILAMLGLSIWAMNMLPPDGQFATHWGLNGQADGFGGRTKVLWAMPAMALGVSALLAIVPLIDPRKRNLQRSAGPYLIAWIGGVILLGFAHATMVLNAAKIIHVADVSNGPGMIKWLVILVGVFFAVLGSVLGKVRPNWFMGIRTPWTLSSDMSWDKTHRLAGKLFLITGVLTVLVALVAVPRWALMVLVGGAFGSIIWSVFYSWLVWKNDPVREILVPEEAE